MKTPRVVIVHLRRPRRSDPNEMRSDPFYEFGSFGCTGCHARNLLNPKRADELEGVRLAFAQGGRNGFRLVQLTPPVRVIRHVGLCEVVWEPAEMPFCYDSAPLLVDEDGDTDFPPLLKILDGIDRTTWPARFSSAFRSRREPLEEPVAKNICRVFDRMRAGARRRHGSIAKNYAEALPYPPNKPDVHREKTLSQIRVRIRKPGCAKPAISLTRNGKSKCVPAKRSRC